MPINVQHIRNDQPLTYHWGFWHMQVLTEGIPALEGKPDHFFRGGQTELEVTQEWLISDPSDGEILTALPGDTIRVWRSSSSSFS